MIRFAFLLFLMAGSAFSSEHQIIDTLGISPKGQFVALEEYGFRPEKQIFYVTIKIMNVWKKEYVGSTVQIERPANRRKDLLRLREEARALAQEDLLKYNISG